jgi:hypothetical protein
LLILFSMLMKQPTKKDKFLFPPAMKKGKYY